MDEAERAFRDALHRVDTMTIPVPPVKAPTLARRRAGRSRALRWLAAAAAVVLVAGLAAWALAGRGSTVPAVPMAPPSPRATTLTDALWVAQDLGGVAAVAVGGGLPPSVQFATDGTMTGADPCNKGSGTYLRNGDELRITLGAMTEIGCNAAQQERYRTALDGARRMTLTGDELVLLDASGNSLARFRAAVFGTGVGQDTPTSAASTSASDMPTSGPELGPPTVQPPSTVEIRIRNDSDHDFADVWLGLANDTEVHFGAVPRGAQTDYRELATQGAVEGFHVDTLGAGVYGWGVPEAGGEPGRHTFVLTPNGTHLNFTVTTDG